MHGADLHINPRRIFGAVLVLGGFIAAGGTVAVLVGGATSPKHAIAYGLGWQSIIGGLLKGEYTAQPVPPPN
jgi:uncharacterized membrane protein YbjE (DUF340 family)